MSRYEHGKIYKITDIGYNKFYVGSTCESLSQRMAHHHSQYKHYKNGNINKKPTNSFLLFVEFGFENCKIELIENYPCESKEELRRREGYYIQSMDCVNRLVAGRTAKEYKEYYNPLNKEKIQEGQREWYENNKEHQKAKSKEYRENNKEHCKEVSKQYREDHKEELKHKKHFYYENNKNKWLEWQNKVIVCECGSSITRGCLNKHLNTTKHKTLIQELNKSSE